MKVELIHELFLTCNSVCIDTRKITNDCMFFALKGDNFNANEFTKDALEKGAKYVIIDDKDYYIDSSTVLVHDCLVTLQELAKYHRLFLKTTIIALTGSNGKTTTKELMNVVLSKKYNTVATVGNLNNHIGVPLTLLSINTETEIAIVEMGANHQKEIEFLCNIAQPDFGYITNFGKAHLEGFGGVEGVIKGKSEMYNYLKNNHKIAFINNDDGIQKEKSASIETISFGSNSDSNNLKILSITADPFVEISYNDVVIKSNLIGMYNANNIVAAILIGQYFNINNFLIKEAIENYVPENNRSQLVNKNSNKIILDAYNANPSSMKAALENLSLLDFVNKTIIIGDMFELGKESLSEHKTIVESLLKHNEINCLFVGNDFYSNKIDKSNFHFFLNFDELSSYLKNNTIENSTILIKGSRGMALERALELM